MSEYFCPNCGSELGEQDGFDPNNGIWTCTNCGKTLYGDDIAENMEQFDGVVWYCDSCGAVLSKQSGFYDSCGTWYCTECGHANQISEDEIYESEEDYQKSKRVYECPHCGSKLNDQYSFDDRSDTHTCTWCDTTLYKDNDEYNIQYRCPNCNSILNDQWEFYEGALYHTCARCNTTLYKGGDEYKVQYRCPNCDTPLNDQWAFYEGTLYHTCSECGKELYFFDNKYIVENGGAEDSEDDDDDDDDRIYQHQEELRRQAEELQRKEKARIKREKKKAFRRKHWKGILLTIFMLSAALFGGYKYWEYSKLIPVGVSAENLQNTDYESAVKILKDSGFTNVHTSPLYDLDYERKDDSGLVALVLISDTKSFKADDKYPYDSRIDVKYHSAAQVAVPVSAKEAKGEQYSEIVDKFKNAGFGDIVLSVSYDLITGWLNGAGEVESIFINGNSSFDSGSKFTVDSKIEIVYHDFKKLKPD